METPRFIEATPTQSGNGFTVGKIYRFERNDSTVRGAGNLGCSYDTLNDNGHNRVEGIETLRGRPSAHLWDGVNWPGGTWEIVSEDSDGFSKAIAVTFDETNGANVVDVEIDDVECEQHGELQAIKTALGYSEFDCIMTVGDARDAARYILKHTGGLSDDELAEIQTREV